MTMDEKSDLEMKYLQETAEFTKILEEKTGVSKRFLTQAQPAIQRLFKEVPADKRESCIEIIIDIARQQAQNEAEMSEARIRLERLTSTQQERLMKLENLNTQVKRAASALASLRFSLYSSLNKRTQIKA